MSAQLLPDEIKFLQRILCSAGCYTGPKNGAWNQAVDEAESKLQQIADDLAATLGRFDDRSERNISSLHPQAQRAAREFLAALRGAGIDGRIISGTRTYGEQHALYRRGRFGDTSPRVTNAKAGESNHNFGIAWDLGLFDGGRYLTNAPPYKRAASLRPASVDWGGNWTSFPDLPHYQLRVTGSIADVRARFEEGRSFVAV